MPISAKLDTEHPWVKGSQVCTNKEPHSFLREDNYKIVKIHWQNLKNFSRTTKLISIKPGTKQFWLKGLQISSDEAKCPFSRRDNTELVKILWQILKIVFSRTIGPMSTKFGKGDSRLYILDHSILKKETMGFSSPNQCYDHICFLIWTGFSGEQCGSWASWFISQYYTYWRISHLCQGTNFRGCPFLCRTLRYCLQ